LVTGQVTLPLHCLQFRVTQFVVLHAIVEAICGWQVLGVPALQ